MPQAIRYRQVRMKTRRRGAADARIEDGRSRAALMPDAESSAAATLRAFVVAAADVAADQQCLGARQIDAAAAAANHRFAGRSRLGVGVASHLPALLRHVVE